MSTFQFKNQYRTRLLVNDNVILDKNFLAKDDLAALNSAEKMARGISPPPKKWNNWKYTTSLQRIRVSKVKKFTQIIERSVKPALIGD